MVTKSHFDEEFYEWLESKRQNQFDVCAISGISVREEQERLLSGVNMSGQASTSSKRVLNEEKEETPFVIDPLQRKLENIKSRCGLANVSKDVERCLLLGLDEMMHILIRNMIRISKQRVDFEKMRHKTHITSDLQHLIAVKNQGTLDRNTEQVERSGKENADGGDKDKDTNSSKASKASKRKIREDELLCRAAEANKAARAVLGGDDLTMKWKLMIKKSQQKETTRTGANRCGDFKKLQKKGTEDRLQQGRCLMPKKRTVSIKDVIAILERDPKMSKSRFIYSLYERNHTVAPANI